MKINADEERDADCYEDAGNGPPLSLPKRTGHAALPG